MERASKWIIFAIAAVALFTILKSFAPFGLFLAGIGITILGASLEITGKLNLKEGLFLSSSAVAIYIIFNVVLAWLSTYHVIQETSSFLISEIPLIYLFAVIIGGLVAGAVGPMILKKQT